MRVMESELTQRAQHRRWEHLERVERRELGPPSAFLAPERPTRADISEQARQAAQGLQNLAASPPPQAAAPAVARNGAPHMSPMADAAERMRHDPRMQLLSAMLRWVFGERPPPTLEALADPRDGLQAADLRTDAPTELPEASPAPAPQPTEAALPTPNRPAPSPTWPAGTTLQVEETRIEFEQLQFSTQGRVQTADGRALQFEMSFSFSRVQIEHREFRLAAPQDPLVLNFDGPSAALLGQRWEFDLNADGELESLPGLGAGSAWLVFDRDRDGRVADGRELFGPRSGDGFAELAALDADGNGWVDEADPAWQQLGVWRPGADGLNRMTGLSDAGVGALSLARLASPFALHGLGGQVVGDLRQSGLYLHEDGRAGSLQQLDLRV
ncbi:hypothetical protein HNQ51_001201 [Inhella inkyongensis]|uniref:VCBS repeat-containing protein n=1 Tax=Inhella inkyongensis TaxID=392593 RepID=A0A840S3A2_9BURK|nr:hypothetical protein [Inhella inkyongensis]MBB5203908.1 hypothetical protein [Inhella inkyongensis]